MEKTWRWTLGMLYVVAVAFIWIIASFVVQSVVGAGVSPFLISYICNSLFVVYLPIVEAGTLLRGWLLRRSERGSMSKETVRLLDEPQGGSREPNPNFSIVEQEDNTLEETPTTLREWSRREIAQVSLLICPFWFLAQFTFNLSLKYTSVTVSIIFSESSILVILWISFFLLGFNHQCEGF